MGTGKSTLGEQIASQLGMDFVDMDKWIEREKGKSINEIFNQEGEQRFREYEHELCKQLSAKQHTVIATGGGTFLNPKNKDYLEQNGICFCLTCEPDELVQRLKEDEQRPLLKVNDPQKRISELLQQRNEIYSAIQWQINTTNEKPKELAEKIIRIYNTHQLDVCHPMGKYPIFLGYQVLSLIGIFLKAIRVDPKNRVVILTNHTVSKLYAETLKEGLLKEKYSYVFVEIEDGEKSKNLDTVKNIYHELVRNGISRYDPIIALGGGVVGDIAGFVAATYYRGVPFIQIPTTLLAMVDSSIGGKTGVDLEEGKNLIGAFKQPEMVLIDASVLSSLPLEELKCGMAEVIKHAFLADRNLLEELEQRKGDYGNWYNPEIAIPWLKRAITVKKDIVQQDPFEQNIRARLNLGHTIGHAVEVMSNYTIKHGEAVSIGLVAETKIAQELGLTDRNFAERMEKILSDWQLPIRIPQMDVCALLKAIEVDKKKRANQIRWVLPCNVENIIHNQLVDPLVVEKVVKSLSI